MQCNAMQCNPSLHLLRSLAWYRECPIGHKAAAHWDTGPSGVKEVQDRVESFGFKESRRRVEGEWRQGDGYFQR